MQFAKKIMQKLGSLFFNYFAASANFCGLNIFLTSAATVRRRNKPAFKVSNYGWLTSYRVKTFESKEPETLKWIEGMSSSDIFFDVGANIGLYSLWAAISRGVKTIAFEPSSLNYAQLNLNIFMNRLDSLITAYPLACHDLESLSVLNLSSMQWSGALSSFDNNVDQFGNFYHPVFRQGAYSVSLDNFCALSQVYPTRIKIDVDGNEGYVIKGAMQILASSVQSVLVEISSNRSDHRIVMDTLRSLGFENIASGDKHGSASATSQNLIFAKPKYYIQTDSFGIP